jgi:hypothetical protein
MEDFSEGKYDDVIQQTAVAVALKDETPANQLLLGLYYYSLINTPYQTRWNYNYLPNSYCPPSIWKTWSPLQRSIWLESALDSELRSYEYKLKSINDMETWKLKMEVQRLMDDLKSEKERAEDELINDLKREKRKLEIEADEIADDLKRQENEAWWKNFLEKKD